MSLKILGGAFKGHELVIPKNSVTRPTGVLLRRKIFDRYQDMEGVHFIDLCAGSGAMGFEALSRGANEVTFVENNSQMARNLEKNIDALKQKKVEGFFDNRQISVLAKDAKLWSSQLDRTERGCRVIVFFDPPYELQEIYQVVLANLFASKIPMMVWVEFDQRQKNVESLIEKYQSDSKKSFIHSGHQISILNLASNS